MDIASAPQTTVITIYGYYYLKYKSEHQPANLASGHVTFVTARVFVEWFSAVIIKERFAKFNLKHLSNAPAFICFRIFV